MTQERKKNLFVNLIKFLSISLDSGNNVTSARSDKNVTFLKFFLGSWKTNKRDKARDLENLIIFL